MELSSKAKMVTVTLSEADPGFSFRGGGGGARKRLSANTHITSAKPEVLEALGVFDALSCYLSLRLSKLIQNGINRYIYIGPSRSNLRGAPVAPPPPKSATDYYNAF